MTLPNTLADIRAKVRKITGRPSENQLSTPQLDAYINTFYIYDFPEHLRLENLRTTFQFTTTANICVYDFPTDMYLTDMPPVYIGGYESYMTQSRQNFYRINPFLNFLQQSVATGNGTAGPYSGTLTSTPIAPGYKRNPPGAYSTTVFPPPSQLTWGVLISGIDANNISRSLVDDGQGNFFDVNDTDTNPVNRRGTVNYLTGAFTINAGGFTAPIPSQNPINAQYCPYAASRPQASMFYQDQIFLYPIPDQAYIVSFDAYMYPTAFLSSPDTQTPQLKEWWQLLAYGAADKIFADNADFETMAKFRPLLEEQLMLCQRRTIVQYTSERTASIYSEQISPQQYAFGNLFSGF